MLGSFRKGRANILIWALMAALVVGLAGFGIGVSGGLSTHSVAEVGDRSISSDEYVRALQQELRGYQQQLGRDLPMTEARTYGIDRQVLGRLINDAALDAEAQRLGISAQRRQGARAGDCHAGVPRCGRQVQPRRLHLRARAHRPATGGVRGIAARARRRAS